MRDYLVELRRKNCLSQQDVAEKLKITRQYYQQIEAGERQKKIDVSLLTAIGDVFGIGIADMASLEQEFATTAQ